MFSMLYAMIFRLVIYMISYLRHPCLIWTYIYVLTLFLTNMYVLDLMHMHIHNDHMYVYDFCFILMFHVLMFIDYYDNAMIIRSLTCMYSF